MRPITRITIIGFLSPALAHLVGIASVAPLLLFTAVVSYPVSVISTFVLLVPLNRMFSRRLFSRKEQLSIVLFAAVIGGASAYLCIFSNNFLAYGAEAFSSLTAVFYVGFGTLIGLICWLLYNWGPFRVNPHKSNSPVKSDDKISRALP